MRTILIAALLLILSFNSNGQYTYMVTDLSDLNNPSRPEGFFQFGGIDYFIADDGIHGEELWRTDGTTAGTYLFKDINPGSASGMDIWPNDPLFVAANGKFFFVANDGTADNQIWVSDGTAANTQLVADYDDYENIVYWNNYIYYFDSDDLYKSDGTVAGTSLVIANMGTAGTQPDKALIVINGMLYFAGYDAVNGYEPWTSDGTTAGTQLLKDINPGVASAWPNTSGPNHIDPTFYENNGKVAFVAFDATYGHEMRISDGTTAGTQLLMDIKTGSAWGVYNEPVLLTDASGKFYFTADDSTHGRELWISDGTTAGTFMLMDFDTSGHSAISDMVVMNGYIYFAAPDGTGARELWKTDGTTAGTTIVTNLVSGWPSSAPNKLKVVNNQLYFILGPMNNNAVIYTSDGTAGGTYGLMTGATYHTIEEMVLFNNDLYFSFVDTLMNDAIWKINTLNNTLQLAVDVIPGLKTDLIEGVHVLNGKIIFAAKDSIANIEVFVSDGTQAGTSVLKDINENGTSYVQYLEDLNGVLIYTADDAVHGRELWRSNGHATGTKMVVDANPTNGSMPMHLERFQNEVYYFCYPDFTTYRNLWRSHGTTNTTSYLDTLIGYGHFIKAIDDEIYFSDAQGFWKSDGTKAGTHRLLNNQLYNAYKVNNNVVSLDGSAVFFIDSLNNSSFLYTSLFNNYNDENVAQQGDSLYFPVIEEGYDTIWIDTVNYVLFPYYINNLYLTDGTVAGTSSLVDSLSINSIISDGTKLWISGEKDGVFGLYIYEHGSGLNLVRQFTPSNVIPEKLALYNGGLIFSGGDAASGKELWISDGTPSGTVLIKDINPSGNSSPSEFTLKDGLVYFIADDGVSGKELWRTDGTTAGTILLADINLSGSSEPAELTVAGDYIYFVADDGINGRELWTHALSTTANCFAYFETMYDTSINTFTLAIDPVTVAAATSYHWDFGDGTISSQANPSHTYASNDIYNVCLTVNTVSGDSCRFCHNIGINLDGDVLLKGTGFNVSVVNGVNGVETLEGSMMVKVMPNPSQGKVTLLFDKNVNASLRIIDLQGNVVLEKRHLQSGDSVDISSFISGIYIAEIYSDNFLQRIKVVKQ